MLEEVLGSLRAGLTQIHTCPEMGVEECGTMARHDHCMQTGLRPVDRLGRATDSLDGFCSVLRTRVRRSGFGTVSGHLAGRWFSGDSGMSMETGWGQGQN